MMRCREQSTGSRRRLSRRACSNSPRASRWLSRSRVSSESARPSVCCSDRARHSPISSSSRLPLARRRSTSPTWSRSEAIIHSRSALPRRDSRPSLSSSQKSAKRVRVTGSPAGVTVRNRCTSSKSSTAGRPSSRPSSRSRSATRAGLSSESVCDNSISTKRSCRCRARTSRRTRSVLPTPVIPQRLTTTGRSNTCGMRYQTAMASHSSSITSSMPTKWACSIDRAASRAACLALTSARSTDVTITQRDSPPPLPANGFRAVTDLRRSRGRSRR